MYIHTKFNFNKTLLQEYRKEFIASDFTASWQYAHSHCNQYFDGLAIVLDQQDNDRLQEAITVGSNPSPQHWIGGSKVNSTWYWNTNEGDLVDFIWFNWGHGQPDAETCIRVWISFKWYTSSCNTLNYFVCQRYMY
ncbi:hypothetical protein DPMN_102516 [Dreissena polymorpha]|uniref:C-type lectin domain-containing protein n=1 Tax=Dreissena polymorpha TaxID=45954 RepID=A0A9D4R963_DREPO|nr:hypothetical protein DPMN_102516 [Dreissena polymorpha]